jgi:predicted SAM-dependent methyltransferase
MKSFLHVGCGRKNKTQTTIGFNTPQWQEIRFDIDPGVQPDMIGTMTDMKAVAQESVDAIFSSHNIEHLYPHEVPIALGEFLRVLKPDGIAVITCPDLQSVCALVASNQLTQPAYQSPAGAITPLDMLYGHRASLQQGNLYMAHRCGFTRDVLKGTLKGAGFASVVTLARPQYFDLWAFASKSPLTPQELVNLVNGHGLGLSGFVFG